jgi:hypothetical protein
MSPLAKVKQNQHPHHYWGLSTALKPTTGVPFGSTYFATDTRTWYIFSGAGWVAESLPDSLISRLIQVSDHSIAITPGGGGTVYTITIDGVACAFTSVIDTKLEISNGLIAAIAASAAAGKFIVSQGAAATYHVILKPAGILEPVVTVTAIVLVDTTTDGYARINAAAGARLDAIYFDAPLAGVVTLADAGVVKQILPIATPAAGVMFFGSLFLTRLEVKVDNIADLGTVIWRSF